MLVRLFSIDCADNQCRLLPISIMANGGDVAVLEGVAFGGAK